MSFRMKHDASSELLRGYATPDIISCVLDARPGVDMPACPQVFAQRCSAQRHTASRHDIFHFDADIAISAFDMLAEAAAARCSLL